MSESVELKTERLLLRPFRLTDAEDVFAYDKDSEWSLYLGRRMPRPYLRRNADEYVAKRILAPWDSNPTFAMVLDTTVIGGVDLKKRESSDDAELGYGVARTHWRKDLMAEAANAVVDWGFKNLGLAKIFAMADLPSQGSWRVIEKLGMTREGVLRRESIVKGQPVDDLYYGLLREEWEAGRASRPLSQSCRCTDR